MPIVTTPETLLRPGAFQYLVAFRTAMDSDAGCGQHDLDQIVVVTIPGRYTDRHKYCSI